MDIANTTNYSLITLIQEFPTCVPRNSSDNKIWDSTIKFVKSNIYEYANANLGREVLKTGFY